MNPDSSAVELSATLLEIARITREDAWYTAYGKLSAMQTIGKQPDLEWFIRNCPGIGYSDNNLKKEKHLDVWIDGIGYVLNRSANDLIHDHFDNPGSYEGTTPENIEWVEWTGFDHVMAELNGNYEKAFEEAIREVKS